MGLKKSWKYEKLNTSEQTNGEATADELTGWR